MTSSEVVLVNTLDQPLGKMDKMEAHIHGKLHRAVSVILFNSSNEILLQRRTANKYHSGGLWTNTCCSHPYPNEPSKKAAERRLREEMGISAPLKHLFHFEYYTEFQNGLIEHELDHVFYGYSDLKPSMDLNEADQYKYMSIAEIQTDISLQPHTYTFWFKLIMQQLQTELQMAI